MVNLGSFKPLGELQKCHRLQITDCYILRPMLDERLQCSITSVDCQITPRKLLVEVPGIEPGCRRFPYCQFTLLPRLFPNDVLFTPTRAREFGLERLLILLLAPLEFVSDHRPSDYLSHHRWPSGRSS